MFDERLCLRIVVTQSHTRDAQSTCNGLLRFLDATKAATFFGGEIESKPH
jgi:hypothetical protein